MYKILQLQKNNYHGRDLQTWRCKRTLSYLPKDFNVEFISAEEVQDNLDNEFCDKLCLHQFKISFLGKVIFSTRMLKERQNI